MKKFATPLLVFSLVVTVLCQAEAQGPGWVGPAKIANIANTGNGGFNVQLEGVVLTCASSQGGYGPNYASIWPNHPGFKLFKADILAAYLTSKPVSLYLADANCKVDEMRW